MLRNVTNALLRRAGIVDRGRRCIAFQYLGAPDVEESSTE